MLTLLAMAVVWAVLVAPIRPWLLTPGSFVRLPLEGLVVVGLAVVLPRRARHLVPWLMGPLLGVLVLVKLLDSSSSSPSTGLQPGRGLELPHDRRRDGTSHLGSRDADLVVAAARRGRLAALAVPALAVGQLTRWRPVIADARCRWWRAHRPSWALFSLFGGSGSPGEGSHRGAQRSSRWTRSHAVQADFGTRPVQGPDRPQEILIATRPPLGSSGSAWQGRPARVRRELREISGPGGVHLARHRRRRQSRNEELQPPTDSPPAAAGSPRRRSAEELARARHPAVRSLDQQPRPLFPADREQP